MDQPHNQFLIKELIFEHLNPIANLNADNYITGEMLKINLYSTGNIDIFKKDINYNVKYFNFKFYERVDWIIQRFYSSNNYLFTYGGETLDIRNYLDKITFIPTEHYLSFTFNKTLPIDEEVLSFIEYIVTHNKGKIEEIDLEPIQYILETYKGINYLSDVVYFNQLITILIIIVCFVFIFILNLKNKYK
jgi:hypothetical protein